MSTYLLDKFLVLAARADLPPVIVINKCDLVPNDELDALVGRERRRHAQGVDQQGVVPLPARDGPGQVDERQEIVERRAATAHQEQVGTAREADREHGGQLILGNRAAYHPGAGRPWRRP